MFVHVIRPWLNKIPRFYILRSYPIFKQNILLIRLIGFSQIAIGLTGFLSNGVTIIPLLMSKKLSSIFNRLLVCLAVFDNLFLTSCVLEAVRRFFVQTNVQVRNFWRPLPLCLGMSFSLLTLLTKEIGVCQSS